MVRSAFVLIAGVIAVAVATSARAASHLPHRMGMVSAQGTAFALVDSKISVRVRGPIAEAIVTQTFRNDTDHATEATYIFPLPADAAVSAMEIETGSRTIRAAIEAREQAQQRYERALAAGVGAGVLDQERPDVFTQTVSAIAAHATVAVTLRFDTLASYQRGRWELVVPMVVAPRYVPGTASGRPTTGTGRAPDTDRAPDASRVTPVGSPGGGGKTEVVLDLGETVEDVASPTHELARKGGMYTLTDPKTDHDMVIRWKAKLPAAGWVEASDDGGGFAAIVVEAAPGAAHKGSVRIQLVLDHAATTRGDADTVRRPLVRAVVGVLGPKDQVLAGTEWRGPEQAQRAIDDSWTKSTTPLDLTTAISRARSDAAVVLISDGLVTDDRAVIAAAAKVRTPIHVIGIGPAPNRSLLTAIATASGGTVRFATVGDDLAALARDVVADATALPEPLKITWGTLQPIELVPAALPRLGAGQATLVIAKVKRVQSANARVRNDVFGFITLAPAKPLDGATTPRGALARRWAKMRLDELIAAGNARAITEHALRYGLVSPYTSMVAIGSEVQVQGGVKHSVPVTVSVPEGMRWQLVQQELAKQAEAYNADLDDNRDSRREDRGGRDHADKDDEPDRKTKKSAEKTDTKVGKKPPSKKPAPQPRPAAPPASGPAPAREPVARAEDSGAPTAGAPTPAPPAEPPTAKPRARSERVAADEEEADKASKDIVELRGNAPGSAEELTVTSEHMSRRGYRLSLSAGGGASVVNGEVAPVVALDGRIEAGRGRTLFGLDGSLWLVDGLHGEGGVLGTITRHVARRLELGFGVGLRFTPERLGPALDVTLRTQLPLPHLSTYLRYDGALLFHDKTFDGQNVGSFGIEASF